MKTSDAQAQSALRQLGEARTLSSHFQGKKTSED